MWFASFQFDFHSFNPFADIFNKLNYIIYTTDSYNGLATQVLMESDIMVLVMC